LAHCLFQAAKLVISDGRFGACITCKAQVKGLPSVLARRLFQAAKLGPAELATHKSRVCLQTCKAGVKCSPPDLASCLFQAAKMGPAELARHKSKVSGGRGPKGKGKEGASGQSMPAELIGLNPNYKGKRLCYAFNMQAGCDKVLRNNECSSGHHLCMRCGGKPSTALAALPWAVKVTA